MANRTGDPRGPGMPGSGGWFPVGVEKEPYTTLSTKGDFVFGPDDTTVAVPGRIIKADDVLNIAAVANVATGLIIGWRVLLASGDVLVSQDTRSLPTPRANAIFTIKLPEGILLGLWILANTNITQAMYVFAEAYLSRASQGTGAGYEMLCQGYCTGGIILTWPGPMFKFPTDGAGIIRSITGTVPAAGADISEVVPVEARWQLLSLHATLTTAVAVASRQVEINLDDGVNIYYSTPQSAAQAASLVVDYTFAPTGAAPPAIQNPYVINYDNSQLLGVGFHIRTETEGIQAADQWTAPQYLVREWDDNT